MRITAPDDSGLTSDSMKAGIEVSDGLTDEGARLGTAKSRALLPVITAGILLVVSILMAVRSADLGYWVSLGPGPGFFPLCLALLLGSLSIVWGLRQWREGAAVATPNQRPAPETEEDQPNNIKQIAAIVGSLVVLALLLEVLGFQLSMLLFLVFHLRILGHRRWLLTIVLSVAGSFGLFILFTKVLSIFLPASSIPFLNNLGF